MSTRLVGTVIMAHADDDGLVLPPRIAPTHVVILPITPKPETRDAVLAAEQLAAELRAMRGTVRRSKWKLINAISAEE